MLRGSTLLTAGIPTEVNRIDTQCLCRSLATMVSSASTTIPPDRLHTEMPIFNDRRHTHTLRPRPRPLPAASSPLRAYHPRTALAPRSGREHTSSHVLCARQRSPVRACATSTMTAAIARQLSMARLSTHIGESPRQASRASASLLPV